MQENIDLTRTLSDLLYKTRVNHNTRSLIIDYDFSLGVVNCVKFYISNMAFYMPWTDSDIFNSQQLVKRIENGSFSINHLEPSPELDADLIKEIVHAVQAILKHNVLRLPNRFDSNSKDFIDERLNAISTATYENRYIASLIFSFKGDKS